MSPSAKPGKALPQKLRRNERERKRVDQVNQGFNLLRARVPKSTGPNKKLSKVDTLREAVNYIKQLQELLDRGNGGSYPMQQNHDFPPQQSPNQYYTPMQSTYYPQNPAYKAEVSPGSSASYYSDNSFEENQQHHKFNYQMS